eukprot:scaffold80683_cov59-Phaeocystis_antarctica.AAC.1
MIFQGNGRCQLRARVLHCPFRLSYTMAICAGACRDAVDTILRVSSRASGDSSRSDAQLELVTLHGRTISGALRLG